MSKKYNSKIHQSHHKYSDHVVDLNKKLKGWFITLTLSPELLKMPIRSQLKKTYKNIRNNLEAPDYGVIEFTKQCNVHYHLVCSNEYIVDNIKYLQGQTDGIKHRLFGFTDVKPIYDDNGISQYLTKDVARTDRILQRLSLVKYDSRIVPNPEIIKQRDTINKMAIARFERLKANRDMDSDTFSELMELNR